LWRTPLHQITYALKKLVESSREGSYATQANRKAMLMQCGEQLVAAGYKKMHVEDLKGRHVTALLAQWTAQALSPNTIRNRLAALRWWAAKVQKVSILPKSNAPYGLPKRQTVARTSKAREVPQDRLAQVRDRYVRMSLQLQRTFGLRREESIKIKPVQADHGDRLVLQGSWTKGGRPREIPIRTLAQRDVLDAAKALAKRGALIPADKSYKQQVIRYEHFTRKAGLSHLHGLRHAYAQERFLELAGFPCPAMGGPHAPDLTPAQRLVDWEARAIISAELGHSREAITAAYLGR
jgi:site-specific recombinase XerC